MSPKYDRLRTEFIMKTMGVCMIVFSSFVVSFFLIKTAPLIIQRCWKDDLTEKQRMKLTPRQII